MTLLALLVACSTSTPPPEPPAAPGPEPAAPAPAAPAGIIGGAPILEQPVVIGGISKEQADGTIDAARDRIQACWKEHGGGRMGKLLVKLSVAADGSTQRVVLRSTTLRQPETEMCVIAILTGLQFPALSTGDVAILTYPFTFPTR